MVLYALYPKIQKLSVFPVLVKKRKNLSKKVLTMSQGYDNIIKLSLRGIEKILKSWQGKEENRKNFENFEKPVDKEGMA